MAAHRPAEPRRPFHSPRSCRPRSRTGSRRPTPTGCSTPPSRGTGSRPSSATSKAHLALRPEGTLALFWNVIARRGDESLDRDLHVAYGDLIPNGMWRAVREPTASRPTTGSSTSSRALGPLRARDGRARALEGQLRHRRTGWSSSPPRLTIACSTRTTRAALFDRIRAAVDANGGQRRGRLPVGLLPGPKPAPAGGQQRP